VTGTRAAEPHKKLGGFMRPLKDYSNIKGFNYSLASLKDYNHEIEVRNMGYAKRLTLNSCRLFMHMEDWKKDSERFLDNLRDFMTVAYDHGITTTPILLMPYFTDDQTPYWLSEDHSCSPIPGCYYPENYSIGEAYVSDIINAVASHPGLLFWDVMNEPSWHGFLLSVDDPQEKQKRLDMVWDFVRHFIKFVREKDPVNALGVGHTFIEDTEYSKTGEMVDIIIFHDYLETRSRVEATCRRAVELSQKYGKPVINNETGCLCRSNPYDMAVETADRYGIGWYLFELMIEEEGGMWSKVHGIVYPDGTVRDPSIVAAILGFFRNRNETAIQSDVNQEGHADKAIAAARDALEKRAGAEELLEAAENVANLLEAGELVPMAVPPTARIAAYRRSEKKDIREIRSFLYNLVCRLKEGCDIV
jgi:hypothetical protein